MSQFTLKNDVSDAPATFTIAQNGDLSGQVPVDSNGCVTIPTTDTYKVYATTTLSDGNTYKTGSITFNANSQDILAQIQQTDGTFNFQIEASAGTQANTIRLVNSGPATVRYNVTRDGIPLSSISVVDAFNSGSVSTVENYSFFAIINGITTSSISTTNASATVRAFEDDVQVVDFTPGYSIEFV